MPPASTAGPQVFPATIEATAQQISASASHYTTDIYPLALSRRDTALLGEIPKAEKNSSDSSPSASSEAVCAGGIQCTWPSCNKSFPSVTPYNHHFKNHSKPFQCPYTSCTARHATKRQLDRHINDRHNTTEQYFCPVPACKASMTSNQKGISRIENFKRHMAKVHKYAEEQVSSCEPDMDEETKRIRRERKRRRGC